MLVDSFYFKFFLNCSSSFNNFQAAIGEDVVDVTLVARRCTRRNGIQSPVLPFYFVNMYLGLFIYGYHYCFHKD